MGKGSGGKIEMKEKKGKEDRKKEGNKKIIEKGGNGEGLEMEKEKGEGEGENCPLKGKGIAEVGAHEVSTLGGERDHFEEGIGAFGKKGFEFLVKGAVEEENPKSGAEAELKPNVGDYERIGNKGSKKGDTECIKRGRAEMKDKGDQIQNHPNPSATDRGSPPHIEKVGGEEEN